MKLDFDIKSKYTIRLLKPESDWEDFRAHVIRTHGQNNYTGFINNEPDTPEKWKEVMAIYTQFGLFNAGNIVGSTCLFLRNSETVFTGSVIEEPHRGQGLADCFYDARLAYLRQIDFKGSIVVGILETNDRSLNAAKRNGFEEIGENIQSGEGYHARYLVLQNASLT